jgi:hypothetical protein
MAEPIVLVINYDENNKSPNQNKIDEIIFKIQSINPDIFILTTQNSVSGTDSHIQHSIRDKINNSKTRKFFRSNTELELLLKKYNLFSKIDATRKSNSKLGFFNAVKPYNVRTRIWINSETVYQGFTKNFSANKYTSKIVKNNPSANYNTNTSVGTNRINNTIERPFYNSKVKIEDYSYKRITASGENGKKGHGSIMISICLVGIDQKKYQYIIGNINPKGNFQTNAAGTKQVFFNMIQEGNVIRYLSSQNTQTKFKGKIFILYISKDNCLYKKIEDNTVNNITKLSTITNLIGKNFIGEEGLNFYQLDNPQNSVNQSSVLSNSRNNGNNYHEFNPIHTRPNRNQNRNKKNIILFYGLKIIIINIIENCKKPINITNINTYMTEKYNYIINILIQARISEKFFPQETFDYNFILSQLNKIYNSLQDLNEKKDKVSEYIQIWKLAGEPYKNNNKETKRLEEIISRIKTIKQ